MIDKPTPLEAVRARIDEIDAALLRLVDERASMPAMVAAAKAAEAAEAAQIKPGAATGFGLRPAREAQLIRKLLAMPHPSSSSALIVRIWRELIADSWPSRGRSAWRSGAASIRRGWRSWRACGSAPRRR